MMVNDKWCMDEYGHPSHDENPLAALAYISVESCCWLDLMATMARNIPSYIQLYPLVSIQRFPETGDTQNGWFILGHPSKMWG